MNNTKHFLSIISIIALAAGMLAFEANKLNQTIYCAGSPGKIAGTPECPAFSPSLYKLNIAGLSYCTLTVDTPCSDKGDPPIRN